MKRIITLDVGTTATKGILFDEDGKKLAQSSQAYPLIQDQEDQAEEDPRVIFDAAQNIIFDLAKTVKGNVDAIVWSAQMHSLIGLDKNKALVTNSITWADNRAKKIVENYKKDGFAQEIYHLSGMPPHAMAPVYKLRWLKENNPQLFAQVHYWIGIKEYLIYRLTGKLVTDTTMAAGTGLLDSKTLTWSKKILAKTGISENQLPQIKKPTVIVGEILREYREKLDLKTKTKIIIGASDGYLSTIGVGVEDKSQYALNIGTSGAVRTITPQPVVDDKARIFSYPINKDHFLIGGPVNNGGIAFAWARTALFGPSESSEDYLSVAQDAPAGSNGLIFLPYLGGERAPIWDADARGSFIGLSRNHTKPQLARSVLEGIIFNLLDASQALFDNQTPALLKVTGGFVQSDFIRQLLADIFNLPVQTIKEQQGASLGAWILAAKALKVNNLSEKIKLLTKEEKTYFPNPKQAQLYQQLFPLYQKSRDALLNLYPQLNKFQK